MYVKMEVYTFVASLIFIMGLNLSYVLTDSFVSCDFEVLKNS